MMIRLPTALVWFCLIIAASVALYRTSDRVQQLDRQLSGLNDQIAAERESLHVLKAEWVYLANPARIASAAKRHLPLRPTSPQQVATLAALQDKLPPQAEPALATVASSAPARAPSPASPSTTVASAAPASAPIASVSSSLSAPAPRPATRLRARASATVTVASADTGHISDRLIIEHAASAQPLPRSIGALIEQLNAP